MLKIFICEDYGPQLDSIKQYAERFLTRTGYDDAEMAVVTDEPEEIIKYLETNTVIGLYFLDFYFGNKMDGLKLATKIRELDPRGFIVFITIHLEIIPIAFTHKVRAMDFILKDIATDIRSRVEDCVEKAHQEYASMAAAPKNIFVFKKLGVMHSANIWNIICLEALKAFKKVKLHTIDGAHEFYGSLNVVENSLRENFIRCHRSYIINLEYLKKYDDGSKTAFMASGMEIPVSRRKSKIITENCLNMAKYY